ncbi:ABC transporter ATP-binding protein [Desulfoplanes formicivorans]|uniref:ABC transporter ATP-binding protein n=1 Tax=Desulfoplanes formicivorans TaxID=1592317 RepID=A0A194ABF9_9BACT|nr:ABC transporter ATP-binding protein [Desulfoplanes formicivorans]GAU07502.1 ABC transporter ATP-binding protein [Desulfoplanes formicivorans]
MSDSLYRLTSIGKTYQGPAEKLTVLKGIDLTILKGQSLAILGASGSGKSTLLHILGTLDTPTSGDIFFQGRNLKDLDEQQRAHTRNREIGFVFQFHHLLPEFNTLENVAMPGMVAGQSKSRAMDAARNALDLVGLAHRLDHKVTTLSGGERQRASIARALVMNPQVILADEPTGNLDEKTAETVEHLLLQLNQTLQTTLVVVTHNTGLAQHMDRQLVLRSGELYEQ